MSPVFQRRVLVIVREMSLVIRHVGLFDEHDTVIDDRRLRATNRHQFALPKRIAIEIETGDAPRCIKKTDVLAVGDRRRSAAVAEATRQS